LRALGEITLVNTIVWSYNRYIREGGGEGFKIGWKSWNNSLENGFDWDPNNFPTNQYAHPYHGSLYFNAARSNGFDYWGSTGFAFIGSFQWEFFGEARIPSINDWVNTSMGGTALGEMTHRLATRVRDNTASGSGRFWSEFGGFAIDPVGGFNRLVTGDMFKHQPNPAERELGRVSVVGTFGTRTTYDGHIPIADTTGWCAQLQFKLGDAFQERFERPVRLLQRLRAAQRQRRRDAQPGRRLGHARAQADGGRRPLRAHARGLPELRLPEQPRVRARRAGDLGRPALALRHVRVALPGRHRAEPQRHHPRRHQVRLSEPDRAQLRLRSRASAPASAWRSSATTGSSCGCRTRSS
jgi:hypothetical protein